MDNELLRKKELLRKLEQNEPITDADVGINTDGCIYCEYAKETGFDQTYTVYCNRHVNKHEIKDDEIYTVPVWCPRIEITRK